MAFVSANGTELYYERHGDGRPVVFCHGDGRDRRAWMPQIEGLTDEFEVVVYDLNGYGRSGGSEREEQSFSVHAEDLRALIDELGLTRPAVVGWSMGGRVAYSFAAGHPDKLRALALLEPASPEFSTPPLPVKPLVYAAPRIASIVGWPRLLSLRRTIENIRSDSDGSEETVVEGLGLTTSEYVADAESRIDTEEYNKMAAAMRREMRMNDGPVVEFTEIEVPTLVMTGTNPQDTHEETVSAIVEDASAAHRETIPKAGHAAQVDNPEAFNETVRGFLEDVSTGADN